ncbi:MAG: (Fe-S)-binding protein [Planctomycetota bacterium]|jgi:glycolate oxidase iron-sulfur subunit
MSSEAESRTTPESFLEAASLDCIHCGLCLNTCPTYQLTGAESSSPRGRVHLMRAAEEGRLERDAAFVEEMDFCLLCRHCESACPAGVQFGSMMEHTRGELEQDRRRSILSRLLRWVGFGVILPNRWALRTAGAVARLAQRLGLDRVTASLLGRHGRFLREGPDFPPIDEQRGLPSHSPSRASEPRDELVMLEGCVMPILFGDVNRATVESLNALGHSVTIPDGLVCCGSLHAHNGDLERARQLARTAIESLERHPEAPIVVNSAGCGSHLRELDALFEADEDWRRRAEAVSKRVLDYSEVVAPLLENAEIDPAATPREVTWDAPCHLCHGQKVRQPPLDVLEHLPGVTHLPMDAHEGCCGSAGIYSLLRPDDAAEVLEPKLDALERTGAAALVTANPGCQLQWAIGLARRGSSVRVRHLAQLVRDVLIDGR